MLPRNNTYTWCDISGSHRDTMRRKWLSLWAMFSLSVVLGYLLQSCRVAPEQALERITVGTFNMEWFGDNSSDDRKLRTGTDDRLLADVLQCAGADILAVQEIENTQAMERLLRLLPEYRCIMGASGGKQRIGFLYRAPLQVTMLDEVNSLVVEEGRTRAGLLVQCDIGKARWLVLAVHLKSTSRADSTPALVERSRLLRRAQAEQLRVWADSVLQKGNNRNIIILGDCNDSPHKKQSTLDTLVNFSRLTFLTREMRSGTYSGLPAIDHIIVTDSLLRRVVPGTLRAVNFRAALPEKEARRVSDHCPIVVQISSQ